MAKQNEESEIPIHIVAILFVAFVIVFYYFQSGSTSSLPQSSIGTSVNLSGNIDQFRESLLAADEIAIIENVTGLESDKSRYVYACGAGLAGSWGKLGKDISRLHLYVIEGDTCTSSSPIIAEGSLSNATDTATTAQCMLDAAGKVTFDIRYGPSYSIFTERIEFIFVDEKFVDECSFRLSEQNSGLTSVITSGSGDNSSATG